MGRKHQEPSAQLNEIAIQIEQLQRKESIIDCRPCICTGNR